MNDPVGIEPDGAPQTSSRLIVRDRESAGIQRTWRLNRAQCATKPGNYGVNYGKIVDDRVSTYVVLLSISHIFPVSSSGCAQGSDSSPVVSAVNVLEAYFDESGTHGDSSLLVVAGYLSTPARWARFRREWAVFLHEHCGGARYFHSNDEIRGGHETKMSRRAVKLIHRASLIGLCVTINPRHFEAVTTPEIRKKYGHAYDFCCQALLESIFKMPQVQLLNPQQIIYTFEEGAPHWKLAKLRMTKILASAELINRYRYGGHHFRTKAQAAPLQAADVLANLVFRSDRASSRDPDYVHPVLESLTSSCAHFIQRIDEKELERIVSQSVGTQTL